MRFLSVKSIFVFTFLFYLSFLSIEVNARSSFWPTREEWAQSFRESIRSPFTWVPITGAAVIRVTNTDKRISNWAYENAPIFGRNADKTSDNMIYGLSTIALGTLLIMPQRDEDKSWLIEKGQYFLVMAGSVGAASGVNATIKSIANRRRPNGRSGESFPSGHTSAAFSLAAVSTKNIETLCLPPPPYYLAKTSIYLLAAGVGWARIEAHQHYPTDVLVAAGLANFITSFIYGAFINKPPSDRINVSFAPVPDGGIMMSFDKYF